MMTIDAAEHRQCANLPTMIAEDCGLAIAPRSTTKAGRTRQGTPEMLGLRRSFVAAAERDLLSMLNHRLGGAGVNHGARNP